MQVTSPPINSQESRLCSIERPFPIHGLFTDPAGLVQQHGMSMLGSPFHHFSTCGGMRQDSVPFMVESWPIARIPDFVICSSDGRHLTTFWLLRIMLL